MKPTEKNTDFYKQYTTDQLLACKQNRLERAKTAKTELIKRINLAVLKDIEKELKSRYYNKYSSLYDRREELKKIHNEQTNMYIDNLLSDFNSAASSYKKLAKITELKINIITSILFYLNKK